MELYKKQFSTVNYFQKQHLRGVLKKRCFENMQQVYSRTPMPNADFNKVALQITLWHRCSSVNLLHIFRTPFPRNTSAWLLLYFPMLHRRFSTVFWICLITTKIYSQIIQIPLTIGSPASLFLEYSLQMYLVIFHRFNKKPRKFHNDMTPFIFSRVSD